MTALTAQAGIFFNCALRFTELALHPAGGDNSKIEVAIFEKRSVKIKEK